MRIVVSVSLILLILLNLFGFYVSFYISRENIKAEMSEVVKSSNETSLQRFEFTEAEFQSLERPDGNSKEFKIKGEMYDVKSIQIENGKRIVYAKCDLEETGLLKRLVSYVSQDSSTKKTNSSGTLIKILQHEFVCSLFYFHSNTSIRFINITNRVPIPSSTQFDRFTPPPELFFS